MKVKKQYLKILEYLSFIKWPSLQYKFWVTLILWNHNIGEDFIIMNECISERDYVCELILPGSISLLVVKLWLNVNRKNYKKASICMEKLFIVRP